MMGTRHAVWWNSVGLACFACLAIFWCSSVSTIYVDSQIDSFRNRRWAKCFSCHRRRWVNNSQNDKLSFLRQSLIEDNIFWQRKWIISCLTSFEPEESLSPSWDRFRLRDLFTRGFLHKWLVSSARYICNCSAFHHLVESFKSFFGETKFCNANPNTWNAQNVWDFHIAKGERNDLVEGVCLISSAQSVKV